MLGAPSTNRLRFDRFAEADAPGLADVLSDPEVTRSLTAKATTPEQCLACAEKRIAWHNGTWESRSYGVWAVRATDSTIAPPARILGWCGFAEPDVGEDPEILYGLSRACWGKGLASEAAKGAIQWLFDSDIADGASAIIFGRLNPGSLAVAKKLGMARRGTMDFEDFLPDRNLARDVLDYEIWRLREGDCLDPEALLFQAPYKAGQIVTLGIAEPAEIKTALCTAASARPDFSSADRDEVHRKVRAAFAQGQIETTMEWYHVSKAAWTGTKP